jgi:hypothetical protein
VPKYSKAKPFDIIQTIMDLQKIVSGMQIASSALDPWHPIGGSDSPWGLTNWTPTGGGFSTPAYRKIPTNQLALKGDVTFTATATVGLGSPTTLLTLPTAYAPIETQSVPLASYAGTGTLSNASGRTPLIQIAAGTGIVSIFNLVLTAGTGANVRVNINCIVPLDS